jgi:hypothetical protein
MFSLKTDFNRTVFDYSDWDLFWLLVWIIFIINEGQRREQRRKKRRRYTAQAEHCTRTRSPTRSPPGPRPF